MHGNDDDASTPAARRLRDRAPAARPGRSGMIWFVALTLGLLGALGVLIGWTILDDMTSHGDEGPLVALAATAVLASAIQVAAAAGIFVGAVWARDAARILCVVNCIGDVFLLLNGPAPRPGWDWWCTSCCSSPSPGRGSVPGAHERPPDRRGGTRSSGRRPAPAGRACRTVQSIDVDGSPASPRTRCHRH